MDQEPMSYAYPMQAETTTQNDEGQYLPDMNGKLHGL